MSIRQQTNSGEAGRYEYERFYQKFIEDAILNRDLHKYNISEDGAIYLCEEIMNEGTICARRVNISGVTLGCKMN